MAPPKPLRCDNCGVRAIITGPGDRLFTGRIAGPESVGIVRHYDGLRQCNMATPTLCQVNGAMYYPNSKDR